MKRLGLILAVVIIGAGAWLDWSYRADRTEVSDLGASLPSVEELSGSLSEAGANKLKRAASDCLRVDRLQRSWIAKPFWATQIEALAQQCELIRAQAQSQGGP